MLIRGEMLLHQGLAVTAAMTAVRRRSVRTLLATVLVATLFSPRTPAAPLSELAARAKKAVVLLTIYDDAGRSSGSGTGFFVSPEGQLVTNHHVIEEAYRVTATLDNGQQVDVEGVLADDPVRDLAILKVTGSGYEYLRLGTIRQVRAGEEIAVIGSPAGFSGTLSTGIVAAVREHGLDGGASETHSARAWTLQISAPISPGSSGSPILTRDGVVVGVAVGIVTVGQSLNFGVSADAAQELLAKVSADSKPKTFADRQRGEVKKNLVISAVGLGATAIVVWALSRFLRRKPRKRSRASDLVDL